MKEALIGLLFGFVFGAVVTTSVLEVNNTTYYQQAEIVAYNDTSVYFGATDGEIFHIETNNTYYPDTVPYLLHMDSMGTDNISDDEILVVWRCVN